VTGIGNPDTYYIILLSDVYIGLLMEEGIIRKNILLLGYTAKLKERTPNKSIY